MAPFALVAAAQRSTIATVGPRWLHPSVEAASLEPHVQHAAFPRTSRREHRNLKIPAAQQHSGDGDSRAEELRRQAGKLRTPVLKRELAAMGVSTVDCFEKSALIQRYVDARLARGRREGNGAADSTPEADARAPSPSTTSSPSSQTSPSFSPSSPPTSSSSTISSSSPPPPHPPSPPFHREPMQFAPSSSPQPRQYLQLSVSVSGRGPFPFVVDSGSSATLVRPSFAFETLGLRREACPPSRGMGGVGAGGQEGRDVALADVAVGPFRLPSVQAVALDLSFTGLPPSVVGLLGLSFLSSFDADFDFPSGSLSLHRAGTVADALRSQLDAATSPGAPPAPALSLSGLALLKWAPVTFGLPAVQAAVNGTRLSAAVLDLGSASTLIASEAARQANAQPAQQAPTVVSDVAGASAPVSSAVVDLSLLTAPPPSPLLPPPSPVAGRLLFASLPVAVADLPVLPLLRAQAVLGLDLLRRTRCVVAFRDQLVLMRKAQ